MKFKTYELITRCIEDGLRCGYARAHKHDDNPSEELLTQKMYDAIMEELYEIIDFEEDKKGY